MKRPDRRAISCSALTHRCSAGVFEARSHRRCCPACSATENRSWERRSAGQWPAVAITMNCMRSTPAAPHGVWGGGGEGIGAT